MSRKQRMQNLRAEKDRRTKKVAIALSVVLVAVLAFEVPKMMHNGSASSSPPAATTTTGTDTTATPSTTPGTTAPGASTAVTGGLTTASMKLPNSDALPARSQGTLYSFSHFTGKNPFAQQLSNVSPASAQTTGALTPSVSGGSSGSSAGSSSAHRQTGRTLAASGAARISVNGQVQVVRVGASFPSSNPLFRLVGASNGGVRIGIANGSYSSGAHTISLTLGRSLTLVDTADGIRYKIRLLSAS